MSKINSDLMLSPDSKKVSVHLQISGLSETRPKFKIDDEEYLKLSCLKEDELRPMSNTITEIRRSLFTLITDVP